MPKMMANMGKSFSVLSPPFRSFLNDCTFEPNNGTTSLLPPPFFLDPEAMEEIQGMQEATQMPAFEMPDIAATLAKFSTGGSSSPQPAASGSSKKKQ